MRAIGSYHIDGVSNAWGTAFLVQQSRGPSPRPRGRSTSGKSSRSRQATRRESTGLILTAAHSIPQLPEQTHARFAGRKKKSRVIGAPVIEDSLEYGLLRVTNTAGLPTLRLRRRVRPGAEVTAFGYPDEAIVPRLESRRGTELNGGGLTAVTLPELALDPVDANRFDYRSVSGFSGGPVIDARGDVVGLHFAATNTEAYAVPIGAIVKDLADKLATGQIRDPRDRRDIRRLLASVQTD